MNNEQNTAISVETALKEESIMATQEKDVLQDCLFSRQDRRLLNIKFMRGTAECTPEALREEVCSLITRRDHGQLVPSGSVKTGKTPINVRQLVADM